MKHTLELEMEVVRHRERSRWRGTEEIRKLELDMEVVRDIEKTHL